MRLGHGNLLQLQQEKQTQIGPNSPTGPAPALACVLKNASDSAGGCHGSDQLAEYLTPFFERDELVIRGVCRTAKDGLSCTGVVPGVMESLFQSFELPGSLKMESQFS